MREATLKPSSEAQNSFSELKVALEKIWDNFLHVQTKAVPSFGNSCLTETVKFVCLFVCLLYGV